MEKNWKQSLKDAWNENPKECIIVAAAAAASVAKVIDSVYSARSKKAYARYYNKKFRR